MAFLIQIDFTECTPAPANGYNVQYRVAASGDPYTDAGNYAGSPASVLIDLDPGTPIEAFIRSDCADGLFGNEIQLFGLRLLFGDISAAATLIGGDVTDVSLWNVFFDMGVWASSPFTKVVITGNEVLLIGAVNMTIKDTSFQTNTDIVSVIDEVNCVISVGENVFLLASQLNTVTLPAVTTVNAGAFRSTPSLSNLTMPNIGIAAAEAFHDATGIAVFDFPFLSDAGSMCFMGCNATQYLLPICVNIGSECFEQCTGVTGIDLSSCTNLGGTTGDNNVFLNTTGETVTLTIPTGTATDGDVVTLQANNTVTLILV